MTVMICAGCGVSVERDAEGYWVDQSDSQTCSPELNPMSTGSNLDPYHEPEDGDH